jgi:hypothetical protein
MGLTVVLLAALPAVASAQPADLFYERTVMSALGDRCRLFTPEVSAALAASAAQARGAALRGGMDRRALATMEREARARAGRTRCRSAEVAATAARVKDAFAAYERISRMSYPGDAAEWRADRGAGRTARWRLAQDARLGRNHVTFGIVGREGADALVAVADLDPRKPPYTARLILRDDERTLGPYLDPRGRKDQLSHKLPPPGATRTFLAEARAPAEESLLPEDARGGWAFRFPAAAAGALARLDPREAVAVEFVFPGDKVRRAYFEVGDFAAGRAFLRVAAR